VSVRWFSWPVLLPGIVVATALGVLAARMRPPSVDVAERCSTVVAILLFARLIAWVARFGHGFGREQRLVAFVTFSAIALAWLGLRQAVTEAAFAYQVSAQRAELALTARTLSLQIGAFLDQRRRLAPPAPRPATWEQDVARFNRFETETIEQYERRFGPQVRADHDLLTFRGMRNRDLDAFYRSPANAFQIGVIADKLAFLAFKLEQGNR
jgi:hypothetical protein